MKIKLFKGIESMTIFYLNENRQVVRFVLTAYAYQHPHILYGDEREQLRNFLTTKTKKYWSASYMPYPNAGFIFQEL